MHELAAKDMALACIDPLEMMERVEMYLPQVTQQATVFINVRIYIFCNLFKGIPRLKRRHMQESEVMLAKFQASKQGRTILAKAKELAQVTHDNPLLLREKVADAVSKLKVNVRIVNFSQSVCWTDLK